MLCEVCEHAVCVRGMCACCEVCEHAVCVCEVCVHAV